LALIYKNIHDWYKELNDIYHKEISRQLEGEEIDPELRKKIVHLTNRAERGDVAADSIEYLKAVEKDYENRELGKALFFGRFRRKDWVKELDIEQIILLHDTIDLFIDQAIGHKKKELDRQLEDPTYTTPAKTINDWLNNLNRVKSSYDSSDPTIRGLVMGLMSKIDCGKQVMSRLDREGTSSDEST
jgi:hypothetical protein